LIFPDAVDRGMPVVGAVLLLGGAGIPTHLPFRSRSTRPAGRPW
jgi:hypothetical protein